MERILCVQEADNVQEVYILSYRCELWQRGFTLGVLIAGAALPSEVHRPARRSDGCHRASAGGLRDGRNLASLVFKESQRLTRFRLLLQRCRKLSDVAYPLLVFFRVLL
ncbi:hypothetical protein IscW_ISCW006808 [Ixodes scapularis]|uniref:Uncharacterized protein n=1 Tax=Ixodes scapularis TaxID=6945 RepID=B7PPT5_IXOSC|nr:hypothetical protein IscW_ISCW006808 [Ixodes scapularis]|eukprot:XP_002435777.1 hypothetical protein IscW_ISCW006808 [Ixodes scapularis]